MAVSTHEGSNLWSPLAITVIGGLLSSTFLTLFIVPSVYVGAEKLQGRLRGFFAGRAKLRGA